MATDPLANLNPDEIAYLKALNAQKADQANPVLTGTGLPSWVAAMQSKAPPQLGALPGTSTANIAGQDAFSFVEQNYPTLSWLLYVPEMAATILSIARQGISDPNEIQALLQANPWWQANSDSVRQKYQEMGTNFGQFTTDLQAQEDAIAAQFTQLGLKPTQQQINAFSYQALMLGWTTQQILDHVRKAIAVNPDGSFAVQSYYRDPGTGKAIDAFTGRQAYQGPNGEPATPDKATADATWGAGKYETGTFNGQTVYFQPGTAPPAQTAPQQGGQLQSSAQTLAALAKQYLVTVSPQTLSTWAANIAGGTMTQDQARSQLQTMALSQFGKDPGMAQAIQAGITPYDYVSPYREKLQSELGIDASGIDFTQPRYAKLLSTVGPDGVVTSNPIWKATEIIRTDPSFGWSTTPNGQNAQYDMVAGLQQAMGFRNFGGASFSGAPSVG